MNSGRDLPYYQNITSKQLKLNQDCYRHRKKQIDQQEKINNPENIRFDI